MRIQRRDFCKRIAAVAGMGGLAGPTLLPLKGQGNREEGAVGHVYQLQAAFHLAKTTQDIDLMMSLWDPNGILNNQGDPKSPYVGFDQLKSFWLNSGSFTHRRLSLVPSFKTQIDVQGDQAWLYFECHDIGDFDLDTRSIASDTFLAGTVRRMDDDNDGSEPLSAEHRHSRWVFLEMTAGRAFPLSVDHYYFP